MIARNFKQSLFVFMVLGLIFVSSSDSSWTTGPDLTLARMDNAMIIWGNYLYTFGGYGAGNTYSTVERIDLETGVGWELMQGLSTLPVHIWRGARGGNKFYMFSNAAGGTARTIFIYDFNLDSWTTRTLPDANPYVPDLWAPGIESLNGYIWILGGANTPGSGNQRAVYRFDSSENTWLRVSDMNRARNFFCLFRYDGRLWVAGGVAYDQPMYFTEVYDPVTDVWTENTNTFLYLPKTVWGAADAIFEDRFWIIGGVQDNVLSKEVLSYDPVENRWYAEESLPVPAGESGRYRFDARADENGIYVCGGSPNNLEYSENFWMYTHDPTPTPSVTQTPIPTRTPTPYPGQPTSTPSPNPPCFEMGVTLLMPYTHYVPGMECYLEAEVCNTSVTIPKTPLFVILEVLGLFYYYPSWTDGIDFQRFDFRPGKTIVEILPRFTWPNVEGSLYGIHFYGAMTNYELTQLLGSYDVIEMSYGPATGPTPTPPPMMTPTPEPGTPTDTPSPVPTPTPQSGPRMEFIPGDDTGSIPGANCESSYIYCFELVPAGSSSPNRTVATIRNIGTDILYVTLSPQSGDWDMFTLHTDDLAIPPGEFQNIACSFSPEDIDDYSCTLALDGSDGTNLILTLKGRGRTP